MEGPRTFEDLLETFGGLGAYQIGFLFICSMTSLINVEHVVINFIGYKQEHWCSVPELQNLPYELQVRVV